ncbi:MAG TPA: hypothetical protein VF727_12855 [Allosphingosinicella sp.]|jgi:hypothetical protein
MLKIAGGLAAAVAALSAAPVTAAAPARSSFETCDGYPVPGKKRDGIVSGAWLFGLASRTADFRRDQFAIGAAAAQACDTALADPALEQRYWLRRANLLQAKALHLIASKKPEAAIAALAMSDAAAPQGEALFRDSIGLGNRALRAMALYDLNKAAEARGELDAIETARPYSTGLRALGRSIRLLHDGDIDTTFQLLRRAAPQDPAMLNPMFRMAMLYARFDEAVPLHGQISHVLPRSRGAWQIEGMDDYAYKVVGERAELGGAMAYALTAQGKREAAAAMMKKARADVAASLYPPVPNSDGYVGKQSHKDYERRVEEGKQAVAALDAWQKALAIRSAAPDSGWMELAEKLPKELPREAPMMVDLILQAKATTEEERSVRAAAAAELLKIIDEGRRKELSLKYSQLAEMLPRPETAKSKPSYRKAGDGIIMDDSNGFFVKRQENSDEMTVGYGSGTASPAMVEELGMLAAAVKTRDAGKDSFLIQSRLMMQRTVNTVAYGSVTSSVPTGYEVRLRIVPVSAKALPKDLEPSRWRLIDANEVYTRLYPKYAPTPQPKG